jgi:subtilisin-like proprotein convertase family protein
MFPGGAGIFFSREGHMFQKKKKTGSEKNKTQSINQKNNKWTQSGSIRLSIALVFLTGILVVVSGTGAENLLSNQLDTKGRLLKTEVKGKNAKRIPNFDVRLSGKANIDNLLQKSSLQDPESFVAQTAVANRTNIAAALENLKTFQPNAEAQGSELTGAVEIVRSPDGLTNAAPGISGERIVRDFISDHRGLYGLDQNELDNLNFIGESISPASGLRMVRVEQIINGRPVFQSETRFILDRDGRIIRSLGLIVPNASAQAADLKGLISPQDALQRTMVQLNVPLDLTKMELVKSEEDGLRAEINANDEKIEGPVTSKLVYFAAAPGVLIPAWSQIVFGASEDWYVLVDARDGAMLWRKNMRAHVSTHDARFRVYVQADGTTPADSPAPQSPSGALPGGNTQFPGIAPTIVSMFTAQNLTASPNGWINDCPGGICTATETQTIGNNVHAYMDRVGGAGAGGANQPDTAASSVIDGDGKPTGNPDANTRNRDFLGTAPRDFQTNFLPPPQGGNPEAGQTPTGNGNNGTLAVDQFRRGSVTQQFYNANWYHDKLFALGFNEAAGNFQLTNFSGMGVGNDRVLLEVQDSSSTDNANFSTPPDGQSGRAQMFRFIGPTVDRDGGLDAEILIHELTHGTSNRLIANGAGLIWDIGGGMGEGWSDFYAMSLLNNTNADDPNGSYASGAYATYKAFGVTTYQDNYVYGIRRFPYSTNNTVNPLTWADVDDWTNNLSGGIAPDPLGFNIGGALEVHNGGEVWFISLWEMRSRIIAANAGSVPTGNQIAMQIVTDAMKLTPGSPSFIQARDALIDADCATNACANEQSIWDGFADRGLGYGARVNNRASFAPVAGHLGVTESFTAPNLDVNTIAITDTIGNSSGAIDPNEPFRFEINLKNPWRNASKNATGVSATISSSTPGVTILNPTTTYPNIAANTNAARSGFNMVVKAPPTAPCGSSMNFTLTITSSLGVVARSFSLRLGAPSGTGAPVTYTRTPASPLAIQDNRPRGTIDSQTITDDFEIADLNVRIDSLPHTFPGDVTFGVKGPNGYGTDVVTFIGGAVAGGGDGDNITNMVLDDEAVGDILLATNAQAPYTGSWIPIASSPSWAVLGFPGAETGGQLLNFDGSSTLGTWQVIASDQAAVDTGTLNGWSLIVTPRAFTCTPFIPVAAHVSVGGIVTDSTGRPLPRVNVLLTDSQGNTRSVKSNNFGYFRFEDTAVGQSYTLNAQAKGYTFVPQIVTVNDEIADLNLTAQQ